MSEEAGGTTTVSGSSDSRPSAMSPQGLVEIALRGAAVVFAFAAFIGAAVAVGELNDAFGSTSGGGSQAENIRGASGWIIFISLIAMAIEITLIVLRFLDPEAIRSRLSIILAVDVIISILFAMSYFAGGVAAAKFADDIGGSGTIKSSLGAAAAFSFFSVIVFIVLAIWSALGLVRKQ